MSDQLHREASRGQQAQDLLDNELFREAFDTVRSGIIAKWEDAPIRDKEGQHELKVMLKLLSEVKRHIQTVSETGTLAKTQLGKDGKIKQLFKRFG